MVLEKLEHTLLGNWFHIRFDARRGREAFPCDGDQGSAGPLRAEKGQRQQGNYCLKYYVRILIKGGEQDSQIWMPECDSFPRFSR